MEKLDFLHDYLLSCTIGQGKMVEGFKNIYYKTNEDLISLCLSVDFYQKDVLSVLASSDQVFCARILDAKSVDTFDFNRLTLYYYYLRIWSIKYKNSLYPQIYNGNKWLKELLKLVKPENELEDMALLFFTKHAKHNTDLTKLFSDINREQDGTVLYDKPKDLEGCTSSKLTYHHISLFEYFDLKKQYDIVMISNILEWAYGNKEKLIIARDNLNRLLRKNGSVICSLLMHSPKSQLDLEEEIFKENFTKEPIEKGYIYIKK